MILFPQRPQQRREDFEEKAEIHRRKLREMMRRQPPDYAAVNSYLDERANQIWGRFKEVFFAAQHRKCGYCEVLVTSTHGDVEHFRPKGAVWYLQGRGRELPHSNKVRGRTYDQRYDSGYWWLAYDWDNYLFACPVCNQRWKSALFPVTRRRTRRVRPGDEAVEEPLLLNPYDGADPVDHLSYDELGQIEPYDQSRFGRRTIETCGLDRSSLQASRYDQARQVHMLIRRLARPRSPEHRQEIFHDLFRMGQVENRHAGMVRSIVKQELQLSWAELESLVGG